MGKTYAGLDVSKEKVVGVWKSESGETILEKDFATTEEGMKQLTHSLEDCVCTVESSTSGIFVYDYLSSEGISVVMANPARIRLIAESDKKTDRNDAEILVDLLRNGMLPTSYVPDKETREFRDLVRHRKTFVEIKTKIKNKVRKILSREGLSCPNKDVLGKEALQQLTEINLQPVQRLVMDKYLMLGLYIKDEEGDFNLKIHERYLSDKNATLLSTMPGIAALSAVTLMSEIGDIKRFSSHEELASYAGLVPKVRQSGNVRRDGGIKQGNKMMRSVLVEGAWVAIRHSRRLRKFYLKLKRKKGPKVAVVAVARKMLKIMWFMLIRGEEYLAEKSIRVRSARGTLVR